VNPADWPGVGEWLKKHPEINLSGLVRKLLLDHIEEHP